MNPYRKNCYQEPTPAPWYTRLKHWIYYRPLFGRCPKCGTRLYHYESYEGHYVSDRTHCPRNMDHFKRERCGYLF